MFDHASSINGLSDCKNLRTVRFKAICSQILDLSVTVLLMIEFFTRFSSKLANLQTPFKEL